MVSRDILNSHPISVLKKEISKTNIKGYSKMKKPEIVELMMKTPTRFSHIKMNEKARKKAEPKKKVVKEDSSRLEALLKDDKPKKKAEPKKAEPKKKNGIDYDEVEEKLDKAFINNFYLDYLEMFLDGKGSEDKQMERASKKLGKAITRVLKKTAKEKKFTTNKELIDYWTKNKSEFGDEL